MIDRFSFRAALMTALLSLAGCASGPGGGIYVPVGGEPAKAPEPPRTSTDIEESEPPVWRNPVSLPAPVPQAIVKPVMASRRPR
jgi:hypothetical protein